MYKTLNTGQALFVLILKAMIYYLIWRKHISSHGIELNIPQVMWCQVCVLLPRTRTIRWLIEWVIYLSLLCAWHLLLIVKRTFHSNHWTCTFHIPHTFLNIYQWIFNCSERIPTTLSIHYLSLNVRLANQLKPIVQYSQSGLLNMSSEFLELMRRFSEISFDSNHCTFILCII